MLPITTPHTNLLNELERRTRIPELQRPRMNASEPEILILRQFLSKIINLSQKIMNILILNKFLAKIINLSKQIMKILNFGVWGRRLVSELHNTTHISRDANMCNTNDTKYEPDIYIYIYIYVSIHTYIYIYIYTYLSIYLSISISLSLYIYE